MNRHYVLSINPQADCEWDRCVLRNPITGERPDLQNAIANTVTDRPGSYLIKVSINVEILEQKTIDEINAGSPPLQRGNVDPQPTPTIKATPKSQRHLSVTK